MPIREPSSTTVDGEEQRRSRSVSPVHQRLHSHALFRHHDASEPADRIDRTTDRAVDEASVDDDSARQQDAEPITVSHPGTVERTNSRSSNGQLPPPSHSPFRASRHHPSARLYFMQHYHNRNQRGTHLARQQHEQPGQQERHDGNERAPQVEGVAAQLGQPRHTSGASSSGHRDHSERHRHLLSRNSEQRNRGAQSAPHRVGGLRRGLVLSYRRSSSSASSTSSQAAPSASSLASTAVAAAAAASTLSTSASADAASARNAGPPQHVAGAAPPGAAGSGRRGLLSRSFSTPHRASADAVAFGGDSTTPSATRAAASRATEDAAHSTGRAPPRAPTPIADHSSVVDLDVGLVRGSGSDSSVPTTEVEGAVAVELSRRSDATADNSMAVEASSTENSDISTTRSESGAHRMRAHSRRLSEGAPVSSSSLFSGLAVVARPLVAEDDVEVDVEIGGSGSPSDRNITESSTASQNGLGLAVTDEAARHLQQQMQHLYHHHHHHHHHEMYHVGGHPSPPQVLHHHHHHQYVHHVPRAQLREHPRVMHATIQSMFGMHASRGLGFDLVAPVTLDESDPPSNGSPSNSEPSSPATNSTTATASSTAAQHRSPHDARFRRFQTTATTTTASSGDAMRFNSVESHRRSFDTGTVGGIASTGSTANATATPPPTVTSSSHSSVTTTGGHAASTSARSGGSDIFAIPRYHQQQRIRQSRGGDPTAATMVTLEQVRRNVNLDESPPVASGGGLSGRLGPSPEHGYLRRRARLANILIFRRRGHSTADGSSASSRDALRAARSGLEDEDDALPMLADERDEEHGHLLHHHHHHHHHQIRRGVRYPRSQPVPVPGHGSRGVARMPPHEHVPPTTLRRPAALRPLSRGSATSRRVLPPGALAQYDLAGMPGGAIGAPDGFSPPDFVGNDDDMGTYEELLMLDEQNVVRGLDEAELAAIPVCDAVKEHLQHTCHICLDGFSYGDRVAHLACSHFYHKDCIYKWLRQKRTCPTCRHECSGS